MASARRRLRLPSIDASHAPQFVGRRCSKPSPRSRRPRGAPARRRRRGRRGGGWGDGGHPSGEPERRWAFWSTTRLNREGRSGANVRLPSIDAAMRGSGLPRLLTRAPVRRSRLLAAIPLVSPSRHWASWSTIRLADAARGARRVAEGVGRTGRRVSRDRPPRPPRHATCCRRPPRAQAGSHSPCAAMRSSTRLQIWSRSSSAAVCGSSMAA